MAQYQNDQLMQVETTCGSLLYELQTIWDEMGEPDNERDKMLLELEQECLEVYRRKVDGANRSRAQLRQAIADAEALLASICASMGERPMLLGPKNQNVTSLREELKAIRPQLEEMQRRKNERISQFLDLLTKIQNISREISTSSEHDLSKMSLDETDLSLKKLDELQKHLQVLIKEKSDRLEQIMDHTETLRSLCSVLGLDLKDMLHDIHPTLDDCEAPKGLDNGTLGKFSNAIVKLREAKKQRMQKLQDLTATMLELWNLMDTPLEEQQMFQNVTRSLAASEDEINEPNILSDDFINCISSQQVEAEVLRLEEMESKMKDLVLKKRSELEDVCRKAHVVMELNGSLEYSEAAIESGFVDLANVLGQLETHVATAKEEAFSRKEILEKVDKWLMACEEENWLEEYNRDENRYNAGRGAHLTLKRAEKARATVNKLPVMVDTLVAKTQAWEREKGIEFTYDGVRLLSLLEEYTVLRQEKEEELRRQRDKKRIQGQLITQQEVLFGSKPSPSKQLSARKIPRTSGGSTNRRLSLGVGMIQMQPHQLDFSHSKSSNRFDSGRVKETKTVNGSQHGDNFGAISEGRRVSDAAGLHVRKHSISSNVEEVESIQRLPFSSVSSFSSRSNSINHDVLKDKLQNLPAKDGVCKTPVKSDVFIGEENRVPATPQSVMTVPMQTAATPAPAKRVQNLAPLPMEDDRIEYSFEEKRLGFFFEYANPAEA